MNESPRQTPDADTSDPIGGGRLAVARRAHEISAQEIAKELHLDEPTVRALEQNDFAMLGAPVFAKGHLRKYAELVGVPVDEILSDYDELNRTTGAPPVVGPVRKNQRAISLGPRIAGVVVVIIVALTAYWWFTREAVPSPAPTDAGARVPLALEVSEEAARDLVEDAAGIVSEPEPFSGAEELAARETAVASFAPPGSDPESLFEEAVMLPQVRIELSFFGDCWTEVSDASGHRLFYDLGTAGRVVALSGDEPLRLLLGDSDNVSIAVEGRDYPIPRAARNGRMARLTINSR